MKKASAVVGKGRCLNKRMLRWLHILAELVDPAQYFYRGLSAGDQCFSLLVLSENLTVNVGLKMSYSAMTYEPDKIPTIRSIELLRAPEVNQRCHTTAVAVSLL